MTDGEKINKLIDVCVLLVDAIQENADRSLHTSNISYNIEPLKKAKKIVDSIPIQLFYPKQPR